MAYVASGTLAQDSGAGGNVTPGLPAGIQANDILVLVISAADNVVVTLPAAYTKKLETNSGATGRQTIAWARATGSDSAPLVTHGGAGNAIGARIHAYRGCVTSGDPFSATSANAVAQGTGVTLTATTITPANNEFTLFIASYFDNVTSNFPDTLSGWSGTNPTFTERTDDSTNGLNTAGWGMGIADGTSNGSATGSRTTTLNVGMSAAGTSVNSLLSLALAVGSFAVIPHLVPMRIGPRARIFHMHQRTPNIPAPVGTDVTVALTGVQSTTAVGTLGVDTQVPLTGAASTAAVGTVTPSTTVSLSGVSSTTSVGTLTPSTTVALSGVASTLSVGSLAPTTVLILSGVQSAAAIGTLAPSTTVALLGVSATGSVGSVVASGGDVPPVSPTPEIIFLLPDGKLAKRIGGRTYQILD